MRKGGRSVSRAKLARIVWEGDSREVLIGFPEAVRKDIGFALYQLQEGQIPKRIRPMTSIGAGVFEIKEADDRSWYRVIYLSKIGDAIHVLHCFEKKSGKTSTQDLETAGLRLGRVKARLQKEKGNEKRKKR